jgi:hypothetical protein
MVGHLIITIPSKPQINFNNKNSIPTSQKKLSVTKNNCMETTAVHSETHTKYIDTFYGQDTVFE